MFEDGDLGLGLGQFGTHKNWSSSNGDASSGLVNRSAKLGNQNARSGYSAGVRLGVDEDWLDGMDGDSGRIVSRSAKLGNHNARSGYSSGVRLGVDEDWLDGADGDSGRIDYYRTRSATSASAATNGGGNVRDTVHEWESRERRETRRTVESRQTREADDTRDSGYDRRMAGDEVESSRSCVHDSAQRETSALTSSSNSKQQLTSSNMALVKSSGSAFASEAKPAEDVYQCYTVTKKTTTTTYGDEDGDEETAVVTTTEKKWREGMNEVGEISVSASASAGELLPSIGAPAHVLADVNNVRTVKSDVIRRYEFQQTSKTGDTVL
nr:hypothetical protein BaRGS_000084 [Batillaria attramentaria]